MIPASNNSFPQAKNGTHGTDGSKNSEKSEMYTTSIFRKTTNLKEMYLFKKAIIIDQLTSAFCNRFLPTYGDRTVDQMIQASRSCKQNIVEGTEDGKTSMEMEIKLVNVARASLGELRQDYEDFLRRNHLRVWTKEDACYDQMLNYCRFHNQLEDFEPYLKVWSVEEMCNWAITLCHMEDKMLTSHLQNLEKEFISEGGIKERMTASRLGFRTNQQETIEELLHQNEALMGQILQLKRQDEANAKQIEALKKKISDLQQEKEAQTQLIANCQNAYADLKQRALAAWNVQQEKIRQLEAK